MITDIRILKNPNGTNRIQMFAWNIQYDDLGNVSVIFNSGRWMDIPVHAHWEYDGDGNVKIHEYDAHPPTQVTENR